MAIIFNEDVPSIVPLTDEQKAQLKPSGILPSGESNFYDYSQKMPETSGTHSPDDFGIFHYNGLASNFSSATPTVYDFNPFNPYVHLYNNIQIPYLSSYKITTPYNPY